MAPPEEMLSHPASGQIQDFLGKFIDLQAHKELTAADFMRTGVYTVSLHRGTNECVRKMQRYNVDTLIVVDDAGRYAGTVSIADIRLNGHVVTDIAPLVRTATPTVHSGDDAKGCFEQLISSGASYLVVLGDEDGGGLDVEHQEQQADKDHAGDGVEQGEQGQDEPGLPGKAGEEDTQPQAQDKADGHRDQGVEQMHADASDQGLGVARQKLTHTVTPRAVPPWRRPCWSW